MLSNIKDEDLQKLKNIYEDGNIGNLNRLEGLVIHNLDCKFAYHLVRLLLESEMIANEHTLDIERNREILKSIRRGEWTLDQLEKWFDNKMLSLETTFEKSTLQNRPDEDKIKKVLIECLEMKYGSIDNIIKTRNPNNDDIINDLKQLIKKHGG